MRCASTATGASARGSLTVTGLLHLLAVNGDTNLVARGGLSALHYVQSYAQRLLADGGAIARDASGAIARFDDALIARGLSPRGSADLLAVTWFLSRFGD